MTPWPRLFRRMSYRNVHCAFIFRKLTRAADHLASGHSEFNGNVVSPEVGRVQIILSTERIWNDPERTDRKKWIEGKAKWKMQNARVSPSTEQNSPRSKNIFIILFFVTTKRQLRDLAVIRKELF